MPPPPHVTGKPKVQVQPVRMTKFVQFEITRVPGTEQKLPTGQFSLIVVFFLS